MAQVKPIWAGFWRRVFAYFVDSVILGIGGYAIGLLAYNALAELGSAGRLIGMVVATIYFGITSSKLGGSQTLGMRLTKLKVVGVDGQPLGLGRSLGRALVLVVPFMLNGMSLSVGNPALNMVLIIVDATLVVGVGLAQIYLLLFNLPTRRMLHDLLFAAVVVRTGVEMTEIPKSPRHANVAVVLIAMILALAVAFSTGLLNSVLPAALQQNLAGLQAPMDAVRALPEVLDASVQDNTATFYKAGGGSSTTRTLIVTARLRRWPTNEKVEASHIHDVVLRTYHFAPDQRLSVVLTYGFDIGIASGSKSFGGSYEAPLQPPSPSAPSQQ